MSDYLPPDVMIAILSRLPPKPLLRFRCVCKSWRSLITSPSFITNHLNQSKTNKHSQKLVLTRYMPSPNPRNEQYRLRFDNDSFGGYSKFKCPFESLCYFRIVGFCDGLVCLSDDIFGYTYTLIIWNPSIHRYLSIPKPSVTLGSSGQHMFALGFGFDARKSDYKIVRLAYLVKRLTPSGEVYFATPKVEIFSFSSGSWRTMKRGVPSVSVVDSIWTQAFLNGSVHWSAYKVEGQGICNVILSFDMAEEKFRVMGVPELFDNAFPGNFTVGIHRESLALFAHNTRKDCTSFSVYVLKEYGVVESWSEMYRVSDIEGGIRTVHGFREDGELLITTKADELVSYEPDCKRMKKLGICGVKESVYAGAYAESLVLLNGLKGRLASQVKSYKKSIARTKGYPDVDGNYIAHHVALRHHLAARTTPWTANPSVADNQDTVLMFLFAASERDADMDFDETYLLPRVD